MKLRVFIIGAIWSLLAASPSIASPLKDYKGADGGWLVLSITGARGNPFGLLQPFPTATAFVMRFSTADGTRHDGISAIPEPLFGQSDVSGPLDAQTDKLLQPVLDGRVARADDYDTHVFVLRLPPGDYQIDAVRLSGAVGYRLCWSTYFSKHHVPFRIQSGKVLYLGALNAIPVSAKSIIGYSMFDFWRLVIDDESSRDLPIAQRKTPGLGAADFFAKPTTMSLQVADDAGGQGSDVGGAPASYQQPGQGDAPSSNSPAAVSRF